jgi:hypothetical protein
MGTVRSSRISVHRLHAAVAAWSAAECGSSPLRWFKQTGERSRRAASTAGALDRTVCENDIFGKTLPPCHLSRQRGRHVMRGRCAARDRRRRTAAIRPVADLAVGDRRQGDPSMLPGGEGSVAVSWRRLRASRQGQRLQRKACNSRRVSRQERPGQSTRQYVCDCPARLVCGNIGRVRRRHMKRWCGRVDHRGVRSGSQKEAPLNRR